MLLGGAFLTGCSQNGNSEEETALLQKMSEAESAYFQNEKDFYTDAEEEEPFLSRKEISNIDENGHQSVSSIYIYDENNTGFSVDEENNVSAALRREIESDQNGNIFREHFLLTDAEGKESDSGTIMYSYVDDGFQRMAITDGTSNLTEENATREVWDYNSNNQMVKHVVRDAENTVITQYQYDDYGRISSEKISESADEKTTELNYSYKYLADGVFEVSSDHSPEETGIVQLSKIEVNEDGNIQKEYYSDGTAVEYSYMKKDGYADFIVNDITKLYSNLNEGEVLYSFNGSLTMNIRSAKDENDQVQAVQLQFSDGMHINITDSVSEGTSTDYTGEFGYLLYASSISVEQKKNVGYGKYEGSYANANNFTEEELSAFSSENADAEDTDTEDANANDSEQKEKTASYTDTDQMPVIDPESMGFTDVRGKTYKTQLARSGGSLEVQPLSFDNALIGCYVGDLDFDTDNELLLVTYKNERNTNKNEYSSWKQTFTFSVFENNCGIWKKSSSVDYHVSDIDVQDADRFDVFLDKNGYIYFEYAGCASLWSDGDGYFLQVFSYMNSIAEDIVEIDPNTSVGFLEYGGSDDSMIACADLDEELAETVSAYDEDPMEFIQKYRGLGFTDSVSVDFTNATMDQNDVMKVCRLSTESHIDRDIWFSDPNSYYKTDFSDCGYVNFIIEDYQNVPAVNSGLDVEQGTPIDPIDLTGVPDVYKETVETVYKCITGEYSSVDYEFLGIALDQATVGLDTDSFGYTFVDMNGDGSDELLILGDLWDSDVSPARIIEGFTIKNGNVEHILSANRRYTSFYLLPDNTLIRVQEGPRGDSAVMKCNMDASGNVNYLECYYHYVPYPYDADQTERYYKNTSGEWDTDAKKSEDISAEEYETQSTAISDRIQEAIALNDISYHSFTEYRENR